MTRLVLEISSERLVDDRLIPDHVPRDDAAFRNLDTDCFIRRDCTTVPNPFVRRLDEPGLVIK